MARRVPVRTLGAAACAAVLALGLAAAPGASAESHDRLAPSSDRAAQRALDVARDALAAGPGPVDRATARNATMALRDLVVHRDELSGADRAAADALLARPTDGLSDPDGYTTTSERVCATDVCVHWVETTSDAVPLTDTSPANGIPDYVDQVLATVQGVHLTYVGAGYREPKPDGGLGGDALTDIYLADVGSDGLYGYCTSDQSPAGPPWDLWAYCVLDNDYAPAQFPTNTPIENMQVTAAHEYFHAVQFGYDAFEDPWFMEASATWAEDELFDDVNDNVFYLNFGQLGSTAESRNPLDTFNTGGLGQYGNWIFLRYLTERLTASQGGMPTLVRDMWRYADASPAGLGLDMVAIQAIDQALRDRGSSFGPRYAQFADANRRPGTTYDEGAANSYPVPPLRFSSVTLSPGSPRTAWRSTSTDHMTSATAQFKPSTKMKSGWKLRLLVDMAGKVRGSRAMVTVYKAGGGTTTSAVTLDSSGNGSKVVGFAKSSVARVELTLVNASMRFQNCWSDGTGPLFFTCFGDPVDDDLVAKQRAIAFR